MNQHLVSIFSIVKDEKVFQFMTGNATVDEVLDVLEQFKTDFLEFKKNLEEREAAKKAEEAAAKPEEVITPDAVS